MKVEAISINQVFLNNRVLKIPFFQRGYVWNEANWKRCFVDIAHVASLPESETPEKYFLGSIILKDAGYKSGFHQFDVIDGQQRLTTIVMFMKALYLALGRNDIFRNGFMQMSLTGENKPILVPNYNDLRVYNEIMELEALKTEPIVADNRLALAFSYFAKRILSAANPTDGNAPISLASLLNSVINYVRLVSIEVQEGENAQKIFETINCTGIKLTTGEMLKNYLFDEEERDAYERTWKPVFERDNQGYWEGEMVNGRIAGSHIENFFYRFMLIKMQEPAIKSGLTQNEIKSFRQKEGLFEKFRHLIGKFGILKADAINEIVSYAKLYADTFKAGMLDETVMASTAWRDLRTLCLSRTSGRRYLTSSSFSRTSKARGRETLSSAISRATLCVVSCARARTTTTATCSPRTSSVSVYVLLMHSRRMSMMPQREVLSLCLLTRRLLRRS